jgi:hypothetical protein
MTLVDHEKSRMDFFDSIKVDGFAKRHQRARVGAHIKDALLKSLICEERGNDAFPFP